MYSFSLELMSDEDLTRYVMNHCERREEMSCNVHNMKLCHLPGLTTLITDLANDLERLEPRRPESVPSDLQVMEWNLSQIVQKAGRLIQAAAEFQAHVHGMRQGNDTLLKLMEAKKQEDEAS